MATTFDEVFEEFNSAFRARDVPALLELYEPDARLVLPDGSVAAGTVAIGEALRSLLLDDMDFELETPVIVEAGDIAIAYARWQLRGTAANGDPVEMVGRSGDVFRRQPDGRWLVVIDNAFGKA